jgi:hypothetical protein
MREVQLVSGLYPTGVNVALERTVQNALISILKKETFGTGQ